MVAQRKPQYMTVDEWREIQRRSGDEWGCMEAERK
jgi:hypothetical protein